MEEEFKDKIIKQYNEIKREISDPRKQIKKQSNIIIG